LASLGEGFPSGEGERKRLVPLLSSIVEKQRTGERNPKRSKEECEMVISAMRKAVFIATKRHDATVTGVLLTPHLSVSF
jgi:hypothetical protein